MDVALVSCLELPEPDPDAAPLRAALEAAGIEARVLAWDDPAVDWSASRLTVLRSCWNYPLDRAAFVDWATQVARVSELWNPLSVVRWSSHKSYLLDLGRRGVPVVPTELVPRGSAGALESILKRRGWSDVVVKPAVSAASYRTRRFDVAGFTPGEAHLRDLVTEGDVLVQPFLDSVEGYGERALVWIDGELTHAVRKSPRFEGGEESVSAHAVDVTPSETAVAQRALETVDLPLLYARVDLAPDLKGRPVVMELELIEPSLFFDQCPRALARFVTGIERRLAVDRERPESPADGVRGHREDRCR